jgi:lactoylglutathione lyase
MGGKAEAPGRAISPSPFRSRNYCRPAHGIKTFGFGGRPTREPSVVGWMPSAQISFRDPDGHSLEYIALLPDPPDASFIGPYAEWTSR